MKKLNKFRLIVFISIIIGASIMELSKDYKKSVERARTEKAESTKNAEIVELNKRRP